MSHEFEQHRERLTRIIDRRITPVARSRFGAEDVVQEALQEAWLKWGRRGSTDSLNQSPPTEIPFSWLYKLAIEKYIEKLRSALAGLRDASLDVPLPDNSAVGLGKGFSNRSPGPLTWLQQQEMADTVKQAVARLKPRDQELIWMRIVDQLTFAEIGEFVELSENSATIAFARALRRLRELCQQLSTDFGTTNS